MSVRHEHKIYYGGRKNVYACPGCKHKIVTVDLEKGVTPFFIECPSCKKELAQSSMYRVPQDLLPHVEWRQPTAAEYAALDADTRVSHVDKGGLLDYPINEELRSLLRATGSFSEKMPRVMVASVNLDSPKGHTQIKEEHF